MYVSNYRIRNYKSFSDSGSVDLLRGFNVIVGQNNAGKSAFLEGLGYQQVQNPHKSIHTIPRPLAAFNPLSNVDITFVIEPGEALEILSTYSHDFWFPFGTNFEDSNSRLDELCVQGFNLHSQIDSNGKVTANIDGLVYDNKVTSYSFNPGTLNFLPSRKVQQAGPNSAPLLPNLLVGLLRSRIYIFKAERLNIGEHPIGESEVLSPNAANLPQVLHFLLSKNTRKFERYIKVVSTVLPQIKYITVPPMGGPAKILIWGNSADEEREDLAIPLADSGTGIGQVLAILYVVINSNFSRTLLIDEPQSFLHPGAARKLIEILKQYNQHQYLLSTHSPTIVSATNSGLLLRIYKDEFESKIEKLNGNEISELRFFLEDIGARLSDVFGADKILWVEGQTEERCFKMIIERFNVNNLSGIEVVGVKSTGELEGRNAKTAFEIYNKLCRGRGLLPPSLAFIFDREGRSEKEIQDLYRQSGGLTIFLPRRMYENYLLNCDAIAYCINTIDGFKETAVSSKEVMDWILFNGNNNEFIANGKNYEIFSEAWLREIHGAKLLSSLFSTLSDARVTYDKVKYGTIITEWIMDNQRSLLSELFDLIPGFNIQKEEV